MNFNPKTFDTLALENNVVGFFQEKKTLKSGRTSHFYINWRNVLNDVFLADKLSDQLMAFIIQNDLEPDTIYGVPEGASPLALITQYKWATVCDNYCKGSHPLAMGRGKKKEHGDPKDAYFVSRPRGKTLILEDVTTTGTSLLTTIGDLRELSDIEVIGAIGLTDRQEKTPILTSDTPETITSFLVAYNHAGRENYEQAMSVEKAIASEGVHYYSLSQASRLLPKAARMQQPTEDIKEEIIREMRQYGTQEFQF